MTGEAATGVGVTTVGVVAGVDAVDAAGAAFSGVVFGVLLVFLFSSSDIRMYERVKDIACVDSENLQYTIEYTEKR